MIAAALFVLAQPIAAAPPMPAPSAPARTVAEDRLQVCLDRSRTDPASAIAEASTWAGEASGPDASYPQQCLGMAYTALLRWEAAEQAFLAAREAAGESVRFRRAQLATMAANAALAEERADAALTALGLAAADAEASGNAGLRAMVAVDRARALVLKGDQAGAEAALAAARTYDAQSPFAWLLSAALARRQGKLGEAQTFIQTAAALAPDYPEIGLEAGVIAMLGGREDAAAASWRSVVETAPNSGEAATARDYLAQLEDPAAEEPTGR